MALTNIDNVPIEYEDFKFEFENWLTNFADAFNANALATQVRAGRATFSDPDVGTTFTILTDFMITASQLPSYMVHVTVEQSTSATNVVVSAALDISGGALRITVIMSEARVLLDPDLILAWTVEDIS